MLDSKKNSGVDVKLGDGCSKIAFEWAKKTFANRQDHSGKPDSDLNGSYSNILNFGDVRISIASDGIGSKVELAERMETYDTLGFDLLAMVVDDLVCNGSEPTNFSNVLDVSYLDKEIIDDLMKGLSLAANFSSVAVSGGEIAELGERIQGYGSRMHFNWCGTGIGFFSRNALPIDGGKIKPGDSIVSLKSGGLRSNGFSMARRILEGAFGGEWHNKSSSLGRSWGEILLAPSLIYTPAIKKLFRMGVDVHGLVHITGGGIASNLFRMLKKNFLGAVLENIFEPFPFMLELQKMGKIKERKAYEMWNMGNGMLIVVDAKDLGKTLRTMKESGYQASFAGETTDSGKILLRSKGCYPEWLSYEDLLSGRS